MSGRNDPCWCGSGKKWKHCHYPTAEKISPNPNLAARTLYWNKYKIRLKTEEQIAGIKAASALTAKILDATAEMAKAGVTTLELNDYAHKLTLEAGAIPATLGYGFPPYKKSICTSLNDVICHGIPDKTVLKEGDILNIDTSSILNGYFGDCSKMVIIGKTTPEKEHVVNVAYECLMRAISVCKPGVPFNAIGEAIESYASSKGCSTVDQFVAHGIGLEFHENPQLPHNRNNLMIPMAAGMTFTIEPMINLGIKEAVVDKVDQWTARTKDGKPSAQWEHTLLITESGVEILTPWKR